MKTTPKQRGGRRAGAGRKPEGKERYTVTLTAKNVAVAKNATANFSGLLDDLLSGWMRKREGAVWRR
jgi:hypothetical protein